jgi:hypothetical protein
MNERYTSDERQGTTRKSAASAKPKSKAAASVTIKSAKKTPQERKAAEKARRREVADKQREIDRKYYRPDTPRYRRLRIIWWIMIIGAIGCTTLSFVGSQFLTTGLGMGILVLAYVLIIGAFVLDFWKIKKERVAYQERMLAEEEKKARAEKLAARQAQSKKNHAKGSGKNQNRHAAQKAGKEAEEAESTENAEAAQAEKPRRSLFGSGFRLSNREKMQAEKAAAKAVRAAEKQEKSAVSATKDGSAEAEGK